VWAWYCQFRASFIHDGRLVTVLLLVTVTVLVLVLVLALTLVLALMFAFAFVLALVYALLFDARFYITLADDWLNA
jgi:hypothetical protein